MKIVDIDYYAIYGKSWLNRTPAKYKLLAVFLILSLVVFVFNYVLMGALYAVLLSTVLFSKVPRFKILVLSFYPLIFIAFYLFSINNLSYEYALLLVFKVLSASTAFILLVFTTSYIEIFSKLEKIFPSFLVSILFITYRSIFILWTTLENLQLALYIRGKPELSRPIYTVKRYGNALGYLIIRAIEASENMYEGMRLRGYSGNLRYLRK